MSDPTPCPHCGSYSNEHASFCYFAPYKPASDLVERLRNFAVSDDGISTYQADGPLVNEAADEIERLRADAERKDEAFQLIRDWAKAYPLSVFPEPDLKRAAKVLYEAGMTLDAISASAMRHVVTQVVKIADAAIAKGKP